MAMEFTRLYGDPKCSGEPIMCAEATGLRERSRRGRRKLRTDQSDINKGQTVRSRGRGLRIFVLLYLEQSYKYSTGTDGCRLPCHQFSPSSLPRLGNCISRCNTF